jgi:hypothetical protein
MTEMIILHTVAWGSVAAFALPVISLAYTFWREATSSHFVVFGDKGEVLGEISAETVQRDPKELATLHERIRQNSHVTFRAAA